MELEQARQIFGQKVAHLSDVQLQSYLSKLQYLIDMILDSYEKQIFGKTVQQLAGNI